MAAQNDPGGHLIKILTKILTSFLITILTRSCKILVRIFKDLLRILQDLVRIN